MPEVAEAFPVLWYPGELQSVGGGSSPCGKGVAVLAEPPQQLECDWLGEILAVAADLCAAHTQDRPQHLKGRQGSKVMRQRGAETLVTEEPDAFIAHVRACGGAGWVTTGSTRKPTPYSVRCAAAFRRGSPLALGTGGAGKNQKSLPRTGCTILYRAVQETRGEPASATDVGIRRIIRALVFWNGA
jgi:hypothetical protein